jgi:hypothetical protein
MNYTKPEITSLASASFAIQSIPKSAPSTLDSQDEYLKTANAYEADE